MSGRIGQEGFTLVELMTALALVAILSTAVTVMLVGASKTQSFMDTQESATSQIEFAYRRILNNVRTAATVDTPGAGATGGTLTLSTQPDAGNGNVQYSVTYGLSGTDLTESDPRYNGAGGQANVLVSNVTSFSVTRSSTTPTTVTLTMTVGSKPPVTRSVTILCRNL